MPNVSVIIINYKTGELLKRLLISLREFVRADLEIIVWDNDSQEPLEWLTDFGVIIVNSSENIGFGRACNKAAEIAKTDNLLFLNPDVVALSDFISPLLIHLSENQKVGALGCLQVSAKGEPVQSGEHFHSPAKKIATALVNKLARRGHRIVPFGFDSEQKWQPVDYVSGACLLVRKSLFTQMHGFDPNYFMYYEEEDLQLQMQRNGYQSFLATHIRIQHDPGSSHKGKDSWKPLFWNSYVYYLRKNWGLSGYVLAQVIKMKMIQL